MTEQTNQNQNDLSNIESLHIAMARWDAEFEDMMLQEKSNYHNSNYNDSRFHLKPFSILRYLLIHSVGLVKAFYRKVEFFDQDIKSRKGGSK